MLVLSRKIDERILLICPGLSRPIEVQFRGDDPGWPRPDAPTRRIRIAIDAPETCTIIRSELATPDQLGDA